MEVNPYYTNFSFEEDLTGVLQEKIQYSKRNYLFEFLFLWIEDGSKSLWTEFNYPNDYLDKIAKRTGSCPKIGKAVGDPALWWGNSKIENEIEINSKLTSFKARDSLGFEMLDSYILKDKEELEKICNEKELLYKSPFGFSGRGQTRDREKARHFKFPIIVEPWLDVVTNYGLTFLNENDLFLIQNLNDRHGQFKGGYVLNDIPENILEKGREIFNWYKEKYHVNSLQIDMFSYGVGELKWNYLCEVNHRKTMGWVLWQLRTIFNFKYAALKIVKSNFKEINREGVEVVELSPANHKMKTFLLGSENEELLKDYLQNFE